MQQYLLEITISWKQRCSVNLEIAKNFFIEDQNIRSLWRTTSHTDNCGYGLKGKANLLRTERLSKLVQRADEFIQKTWVHKEWSYYPIERANAIPKGNTVVQMPKAQNNRLTFITTYDRTNPDIKEVPQKHWHLLQFEPLLETVFSEPLIIAFKRNKNLGDILGSKNLNDSKVVRHEILHDQTMQTVHWKHFKKMLQTMKRYKLILKCHHWKGIQNLHLVPLL